MEGARAGAECGRTFPPFLVPSSFFRVGGGSVLKGENGYDIEKINWGLSPKRMALEHTGAIVHTQN